MMTPRPFVVVVSLALVLGVVGCNKKSGGSGGGGSPTAPTPAPTPTPPPAPTPTTFTLSGQVVAQGGSPLANVRVEFIDGDNRGKATTTGPDGRYQIPGCAPGGYTVVATLDGYIQQPRPIGINGNTTLNFTMLTAAPWTRSGQGNTVFDMPTYITRVRIRGVYTSSGSNFIVRIGGRLVVNDIIGTRWPSTVSDGVYLTSGGVVEITSSTGVDWTFTEVR